MTQANESIENINREVYKKLESYSKVQDLHAHFFEIVYEVLKILSLFANKRHTKDSMAADFLDMLVFGDVSPEVENFLKVSFRSWDNISSEKS